MKKVYYLGPLSDHLILWSTPKVLGEKGYVAGDVYDSVFLCCRFSHEMYWMGSGT